MVRIFAITSVATIIILGCYSFFEKKLFDLYSLRCTHVEFDNIEKWFMVKKKLTSEQAHAIFEEPWHSKTFDKSTKVKDLSLWGVLTEASATNLFFSQNNYSLIKINRINLNLSIESKGVSLYSCEKKSPDKLYSAIENKLLKLRTNIQI